MLLCTPSLIIVRVSNDSETTLIIMTMTFLLVFGQAVPLVPFSESQEMALSNSVFRELLRELNFNVPSESRTLYPRFHLKSQAADLCDLCHDISRYTCI